MSIKVALISCGRSDYSIYRPIMKKLKEDPAFELKVIAFGTHVSRFYDKTVDFFHKEEFYVDHEVESLVLGDSSEAVSSGMGLTLLKFSTIWAKYDYDIIMVLGDRYEMFSAIAASVPFNIPVAHLHGGETTLGAIDDKFRHCITSMSHLHFASTQDHAQRIVDILGHDKGVYNVGAPALDNLVDLKMLSVEEFNDQWNIDLSIPTVLVTYHPETVALEKNAAYVEEMCDAMMQIDRQFLITMPNNDTLGTTVREILHRRLGQDTQKYKMVEVLGAQGYYSCMTHCDYLMGNTSSGIVEAASFGKYVLNLGDRQKGRSAGNNVIHVEINAGKIVKEAGELAARPSLNGDNIYWRGSVSDKIANVLKEYFKES